MNRKVVLIAATIVLAMGLQACSSMQKMAGQKKNSPDEFQVVSKPPLVMPPDFNLRPPKPGEPTPQALTTSQRTIQSLFPGRTTLPPAPSAGEKVLLDKVGAGKAKSSIRSNAGTDTLVVEKGTLLRNILGAEEREDAPDKSKIEKVEPKKK
ncbi:MAG: DUF3035 domain-containing protein [Sphingomonadales bacterium]